MNIQPNSDDEVHAVIMFVDAISVRTVSEMDQLRDFFQILTKAGLTPLVAMTKCDKLPGSDIDTNYHSIYEIGVIDGELENFSKNTGIPKGNVFPIVNFTGENSFPNTYITFFNLNIIQGALRSALAKIKNFNDSIVKIQRANSSNFIYVSVPSLEDNLKIIREKLTENINAEWKHLGWFQFCKGENLKTIDCEYEISLILSSIIFQKEGENCIFIDFPDHIGRSSYSLNELSSTSKRCSERPFHKSSVFNVIRKENPKKPIAKVKVNECSKLNCLRDYLKEKSLISGQFLFFDNSTNKPIDQSEELKRSVASILKNGSEIWLTEEIGFNLVVKDIKSNKMVANVNVYLENSDIPQTLQRIRAEISKKQKLENYEFISDCLITKEQEDDFEISDIMKSNENCLYIKFD